MLIDYSFRLDRVLGVASGTWDVSTTTLNEELDAMHRVGKLLRKKGRINFRATARACPADDRRHHNDGA